jgi:hypothetical protein
VIALISTTTVTSSDLGVDSPITDVKRRSTPPFLGDIDIYRNISERHEFPQQRDQFQSMELEFLGDSLTYRCLTSLSYYPDTNLEDISDLVTLTYALLCDAFGPEGLRSDIDRDVVKARASDQYYMLGDGWRKIYT